MRSENRHNCDRFTTWSQQQIRENWKTGRRRCSLFRRRIKINRRIYEGNLRGRFKGRENKVHSESERGGWVISTTSRNSLTGREKYRSPQSNNNWPQGYIKLENKTERPIQIKREVNITTGMQCNKCLGQGHIARNCNRQAMCSKCRQRGHVTRNRQQQGNRQ